MAIADNLLVEGCLKGDPRYQQALYEQYRVELFVVCLRYARDRSEAEDLLQEGFIQVFRDLYQYDVSRGALQSWVRKVMINTVLQHVRKKKIRITANDLDTYQNQLYADEQVLSKLSAREIVEHIQRLPEGYRIVFNLFMIEGYTHQEIAERLNISVNTSKTQLFKARSVLQRKLNHQVSS